MRSGFLLKSTTPYSQGFQASLSAQPTPLRESLGRSNQRGSKTSQASYGHPRCDLDLVRLFRLFVSLLVLGRFFFFTHPRGHECTAPSAYCTVSSFVSCPLLFQYKSWNLMMPSSSIPPLIPCTVPSLVSCPLLSARRNVGM